MTGILVQWYLPISLYAWCILLFSSLLLFFLFFLLPLIYRYRLPVLQGITGFLLFAALGGLLTWQKDIRNNDKWFAQSYKATDALIVTLDEPLVEKERSWKAVAAVDYITGNNNARKATGKIILYFQKDSLPLPGYGTRIIFKKQVQLVSNLGNPGGFDQRRYCLFQGITHQVFLKNNEFSVVKRTCGNWLDRFIYASRDKIVSILRTNIRSEKELGLAEALLIGYKNDLDRSLVRSYTNTGVVHIIAISGLHLGLIYWLLAMLMQPLSRSKKWKWLRPLLIIAGLWIFSLLAGAQPSILRSALMFTCIVLGESLTRKTSIYNTMALSAFILLCIDPFWLWDIGFQLSYSAVLSIILFMRPVYNWFCIQNKILDLAWKMNAVTIAAQILTIPVSLYHFHQFPNLFLLTNFLAVPLSSAVLLAEILLCLIAFLPPLALLVGKITGWMIMLMNRYIEHIESLPFAVWNGLQIDLCQTILLYFFITGFTYWLIEKYKAALQPALLALLLFFCIRSYSFIQCSRQNKLIVYNIPKRKAIDIITGRSSHFITDSIGINDPALDFHIKPARSIYRTGSLNSTAFVSSFFEYRGKHFLLIDRTIYFDTLPVRPVIDYLILSGDPKLYMSKLAKTFFIRQVVIDASTPARKARHWIRDCDSLAIPCHNVATGGAYTNDLR